MAEIGKLINGAFDKGYDAYTPGAPSYHYNPYRARHLSRAFKAGWGKAHAERLTMFSDEAIDARCAEWTALSNSGAK